MKNFEILSTTNQEMPFIVVATSYINPMGCLPEMANESILEEYEGVILFDNLLSNGFSSNRFLSLDFKNGRFDYSSAKIVSTVEKEILVLVYNFFHEHPEFVEVSCLPSPHRHILKHNLLSENLKG